MKKLTYFFTLVIFAGLSSCGSGERAGGAITMDVGKSYPQITIDINDIADVEYLPLGVSNDFLLSEGNVSYFDDDIIVFAQRTGDIMFFDYRTGKAVKSFNRLGKGNEEYPALAFNSIAVDRDKNEVYVNNPQGNCILVYDTDGRFKRRLECHDKRYNAIYNFDPDNLLVHDNVMENSLPFLLISKLDGMVVEELTPPVAERLPTTYMIRVDQGVLPMLISYGPILKTKEGFLMADISYDTIYRLTGSGGVPEPVIARTPSARGTDAPVFIFPALETRRYLMMSCIGKNPSASDPMKMFYAKTFAYDREDGSFYEPTVISGDYDNWRLPVNSGAIGHNTVNAISVNLSAVSLVIALEEGKLHGKLREVASTLKEDDNPVIMIVRFK